ncbi:MAG: hypothetical protein LRY38_03670 [Aeromonadaceae bacterium]|nr:hypothetical protein [Aeromonadaceae bacterium]
MGHVFILSQYRIPAGGPLEGQLALRRYGTGEQVDPGRIQGADVGQQRKLG